MKSFILIQNITAILLICITSINAQESVNTSGGEGSGTGGSTSYSIGQLVYTTHIGTNGSVAEGVQQPFEIYVINSIEDAEGIQIECKAYPNPAQEFLTLSIKQDNLSGYNYQLLNLDGKVLKNAPIMENRTIIPMQNLIPAYYILKVSKHSSTYKTFKIIKTK